MSVYDEYGMEYNVVELLHEGYHLIQITGKLRDTDAHKLHEDILEVADRLPEGRFLVDIRHLEERLNVFETMGVAHSVLKGVIGKIRKVAILDDITNRTSAIIAETVMAGRGLQVNFFFDEAMAIEWLLA